MALESPLIRDGSQNTLSTANDARRSSITGSTLAGPNGSGQFLGVYLSTTTDRQVSLCSTTFQNLSTLTPFYGVLQNTPGPGLAADVGIMGVTKVVAGSTGIVRGTLLQTSSTLAGVFVPYAGGNGRPVAMALESATSATAVITAIIGPSQFSCPST